MFRGKLDEREASHDIRHSISRWILDRSPNIDLGGKMKDCLGLDLFKELFQALTVADIKFVELCPSINVLFAPTREIIEDSNPVTTFDEDIGDMRTDKSSTTRDEYAHILNFMYTARNVAICQDIFA